MKKETKKAPTIRFRGFTDDWEQHKFGEIAEYKKGPFGSALKKDFFIPDSAISVKVYEQQNAINKNWNLSRYYISKEYAQKLKSFEVHAGDIIVSCAGTIGEIYELPAQSRSGIINQALMRIRVDEKTVCKDIFKLAFSNMIDSFSREFSNGSAIKNIPPFADLKPMKVLLPNKDEQTIIGDFFTDIDKTITLHQRKLDQLKKLKKYFLQNMFPAKGEKVPRIRFKGFTGDWEQHKLSDLVEKICVGFVGTCEKYYTNAADGIPMYRTGDLSEFALNHTGIKYVTREFHKKNKKSQLKYGDILIARHGDSGKAIVYDRNEEANCLNIVIIRPNSARCNGKFLAQRINTFSVSHKIKKMAAGSTQIVINTTDIEKLILQIPKNLNEQAKIISCFISIDNLITFHQRNLNQLQTMKKFMLQNMFI